MKLDYPNRTAAMNHSLRMPWNQGGLQSSKAYTHPFTGFVMNIYKKICKIQTKKEHSAYCNKLFIALPPICHT